MAGADAAAQTRGRPAPPPVVVPAEPQPTPTLPPAPRPEPLQRRLTLDELGLGGGLAFGAEAREISFPLPSGWTPTAARLLIALDLPPGLAATLEVALNGRAMGADRVLGTGQPIGFALDIPAAELARAPEALRLGLRLPDAPPGAAARLRADSHLALMIAEGAPPPVAALHRLLPRQVAILLRPGPVGPAEATAALRLGLALAALGREVRITSTAPTALVRREGASRIWETGVVMLGTATAAAPLGEALALVLGSPPAESAARLLETAWAPALPPAGREALPLAALRGAMDAQETTRAAWSFEVSMRDLPAGTRPQALDLALRAAGGSGVATVLLNETLLGAAALPAEGTARLSFAIPERLVGLDNRIAVLMQRSSPAGAARIEPPGSALRLAPAPAPREFLALPPAFATGFDVFLDAPGGLLTAEGLNLPLWVLRALAPPRAELAVTLQEPGGAPQPRRAFLAVTREPPAGTDPVLRFDAGPVTLADRRGTPLPQVPERLVTAQLLQAGPAPGAWLRLPEGRLPFRAAAGRAAPRPGRCRVAGWRRRRARLVERAGRAGRGADAAGTRARRVPALVAGRGGRRLAARRAGGAGRLWPPRADARGMTEGSRIIVPPARRAAEALVSEGLLSPAGLAEAEAAAARAGVPLQDALMARPGLRPLDYFRDLAAMHAMPLLDLARDPPDRELLDVELAAGYAQHGAIPWRRHADGTVTVAVSRLTPETAQLAWSWFGRRVRFAVATPRDISRAAQRAFAEEMSHRAVHALAERDPQMSARQVMAPMQAAGLWILGLTLLAALLVAPGATLLVISALMGVFYLGNLVFRGALVLAGAGRGWGARDKALEEAAAALTEAELPTFTILVPMFREPEVLPILVHALRSLDYPRAKLDIKIVLEEGDDETIAAAQGLDLEGIFEIVLVPPSHPKTKPKACNYAMQFARGELLVIYDAEDKPEPDQLRKVVAAFRRSGPKVACVQCRLNYYNARENWLTRMFTLDYSLWFDLMLPGLERLGAPIPLGGTSNHFRTQVLRDLHAWDPFNVTEDADLGIRLTQKGYRVAVIDSTTYEEANCRVGNWVRQRSRWIKGYMQTFLVHTRRPAQLWRAVGPMGLLGFVFFVGGTALSGVLNPIFWAVLLAFLLLPEGVGQDWLPPALAYVAIFNLVAGNGLFIWLSMLAPLRRRWLDLVPLGLTAPLYWGLISVAAWKALVQLVTKPFYWEKTQHGLSKHVATELARVRAVQAGA
jgi:cellulose synthase/poly-beta-1,6-N-acetylglucosamine synthase-like glycosyltransferase